MSTSNQPNMKERQLPRLPPAWCSGICRNAMNEMCIEHCAVRRDCSAFEPKSNLQLSDMPRFPLEESLKMTKEEKFTAVTVYLAKIVDHLNGVEDEQNLITFHQVPYVANLGKRKVVADMASVLQGLQSGTEGVEINKVSHQTDQRRNSQAGSEIKTSQEAENV